MKISIILGKFSVGPRPLDFNNYNIWKNPRGLTGTDLSTIMISIHLAKRGHEVHLFTIHADSNNKPKVWEGIQLYNLDERLSIIDNSFDIILSINEPDVFRGLPIKPLRVCWQFLNDFLYCEKDFDNYVDKWLGVCEPHVNYLKTQLPPSNKWEILGLGCEPEWYEDSRIPGRVVWCSSADRGLHWLLQEWPKIKAAVPYATLKIFYHLEFGNIETIEPNVPESPEDTTIQGETWSQPPIKEMGHRVRYIKSAIKRLKSLGVEHVGSISRDQIRQELSEASVLGFCCDTSTFSEGFSVTTLEAHASFTVPIITDQDCLGYVYKKSGALIVKSPVRDNLDEYVSLVIKSLADKRFSDSIIDKCRVFAMQNTWDIVTGKMEQIMQKGKS